MNKLFTEKGGKFKFSSQGQYLASFIGNVTKVKIPSEIKPPLFRQIQMSVEHRSVDYLICIRFLHFHQKTNQTMVQNYQDYDCVHCPVPDFLGLIVFSYEPSNLVGYCNFHFAFGMETYLK